MIKLELKLEDVNKILLALSHMPYKDVFEVVNEIHLQGNEQVEEKKDIPKISDNKKKSDS